MADDPKKTDAEAAKPPASTNTIETGMESERALGMDTSDPEGQLTRSQPGQAVNVETGELDIDGRIDLTDEEKQAAKDELAAAADEGAADEGTTAEPLPAFEGDKEEVKQAYDARYKPDGKLSLAALSADWEANSKGDVTKGTLSEDTYKYLESIGIDRETAKAVEANQVVALKSAAEEVYSKVPGGKKALEAMLEWGKGGGYSEAQRAAFNKAYKGTDPVAREDAIEALTSRYAKANPTRRPVTPKKSSQDGGNAQEVETGAGGYKDHDEYLADFKKANALRGREADKAREATRAKLRASTWFKKRK